MHLLFANDCICESLVYKGTEQLQSQDIRKKTIKVKQLAIYSIKMIVNLINKLYLTPVKTQLLQYNLTRDLMLLYHSNKLKA